MWARVKLHPDSLPWAENELALEEEAFDARIGYGIGVPAIGSLVEFFGEVGLAGREDTSVRLGLQAHLLPRDADSNFAFEIVGEHGPEPFIGFRLAMRF